MRTGDFNDKELLDAALAAEPRAWSALVDRYAPLIWSTARGCGLDQADAEDVAQVVFTTLLRRLPYIENQESLGGWLVVTAKRESWRLSARNRRRSALGADALERGEGSAEGSTTEEQLERQQAIRHALAKLDTRCRDLLLELFGQAGALSYSMIADRLGLTPNSIGPTRRRCLDKLLKELRESSADLF